MSAINNFNVLPFYTSLSKQNSKKWYSFGNVYPLASPKDKILPFQIIMASVVSTVSSITIHNQKTGATTSSGLTPTIFTPEGSNYSIVYLKLSSISSLQEGRYYLSFNIDGITMYSEIFNAISDLSEYVKLEYWNEDDLYNRDKIQVYFGDDFRFTMYICTDIGKPEYIFEEELTKRLGYKFLESQISNKLYKFTFLAPEYMTDSMRIIRLCDFIKLTQNNEEYNALNFAYDAKWEQQGDLASVECEFETDTIIQKLQSFNRRQQQSFYNALLSNIDEPILFDTEVVAQYYADFQTGGLIQGKLIHELELETELKPGAFIPIDNNDGAPAKKISVTALTSSSHTHANKEFLDIINQGLSKDSSVQFKDVIASGAITAGAANGIPPDDLPAATDQVFGVVKIDGVTIKIDPETGKIYAEVSSGGVSSWNDLTDKPANLIAIAALTGAGLIKRNVDGTYNVDTTVYQTYDADLATIAAIADGVGYLKRTGQNTWIIDTNTYLTAITKTMVENVLTGIITSHQHNYLPINGGNLTGPLTILTHTAWHAGNDGTGSGLDADLLDGQHGSFYFNRNTLFNANNVDYNAVNYEIGHGVTTQPIHLPNYTGAVNAPFSSYGQMIHFDGNSFFPFRIAFDYAGRMFFQGAGYKPNGPYNYSNGTQWFEFFHSGNSNKKTVDWSAKDLKCVNTFADGAVVAGALNGTPPDDLPVATSSLFGVIKTGLSLHNNAGVVNINGRHYTTTSTYTDAAVREITAEIALGTGSMANGTLDQIQLSFAPLTTTRGLTANVIATNTGAGMGLKLSFRKDTGTGRWYIMIYNDSGAAVTRDGILLSIRGQQTI